MKILLFIVAMAVSGAAIASDWVDAGSGNDGIKFAMDAESIRRTGNVAQVWVQLTYPESKQASATGAKELWKFNCVEQTSFRASRIEYDAKGVVKSSYDPPEYRAAYKAVPPDSMYDWVMRKICQ